MGRGTLPLTTILIAEDDPMLARFLRSLLGEQPDLKIVGAVRDGSLVAESVRTLRPDLLLLDLNLPGRDGLEILEDFGNAGETPPTLMLTAVEDEDTAFRAAQLGARGFVGKTDPTAELLTAIREVAKGGTWFSSRTVSRVLAAHTDLLRQTQREQSPLSRLSEREKEVLRVIGEGLSNQEIAAGLGLRLSTVKMHVRSLFRKLDARSRTELAVFASREGLVPDTRHGER
jgi:DNA-binding NarL/FixJ family response regulator